MDSQAIGHDMNLSSLNEGTKLEVGIGLEVGKRKEGTFWKDTLDYSLLVRACVFFSAVRMVDMFA